MGDVATFGCFGLVFGWVSAIILIALSYGRTAWALLILVAPRLGLVI